MAKGREWGRWTAVTALQAPSRGGRAVTPLVAFVLRYPSWVCLSRTRARLTSLPSGEIEC